jgi:nucleoside-diphosphate-sugar epimerase
MIFAFEDPSSIRNFTNIQDKTISNLDRFCPTPLVNAVRNRLHYQGYVQRNNIEKRFKILSTDQVNKNYIISTGKAIKLANIVNTVLDYLKLDPKIIINSKNLFRIKEVELSYGDNSDIIKDLNWDPNTEFTSTLIGIINEELNFQSIRKSYGKNCQTRSFLNDFHKYSILDLNTRVLEYLKK